MITSFQNTQAPAPLSPFDVSASWDFRESRPFHRLRAPFHSSASLPLNAFLSFSNWPFRLPLPVRNTSVCPHLQKGGPCSSHSRRLHTLRLPPPPRDTRSTALGRPLHQSWRLCDLGPALQNTDSWSAGL